ncbi:LPS assembly lipoprotein LptE [Salinivirga cyanobacteriivorans]
MTSMLKVLKYFGLAIISLFFTACTVSYSFTGASIPIEAKTFTVRKIDNVAPTINPTLANNMQLALIDRMLTQTRLNSVDFNGDLIYDITITDYDVKPISISGGEQSVASENRLTIRVKVKFDNRYDPESSFERTFSQYADYASDSNFSDVESGLVQTIIEQLTEDIFNASVVNW